MRVELTWLVKNESEIRDITVSWNFKGVAVWEVSDNQFLASSGDKTFQVKESETIVWILAKITDTFSLNAFVHEDTPFGYLQGYLYDDDGFIFDYEHTNGKPKTITLHHESKTEKANIR